MPISPTGNRCSSLAAAGARCPVAGAAISEFANHRGLESPGSANISKLRHRARTEKPSVITADMNVFDPERSSTASCPVEMFEHMMETGVYLMGGCGRGWRGRPLLHAIFLPIVRAPICSITPRGRLDRAALFTGGVMPSPHLVRQYADSVRRSRRNERWSGTHYQRTGSKWLGNFDSHRDEIEAILRKVYGNTPSLGCGAGAGSSSPHRAVRLRRRHRMGRQPFQDEGA